MELLEKEAFCLLRSVSLTHGTRQSVDCSTFEGKVKALELELQQEKLMGLLAAVKHRLRQQLVQDQKAQIAAVQIPQAQLDRLAELLQEQPTGGTPTQALSQLPSGGAQQSPCKIEPEQELQELLREAASSRPVLQQLLEGLAGEGAKVQVAPVKGLVRVCVCACVHACVCACGSMRVGE